jgi:hypothetical protein
MPYLFLPLLEFLDPHVFKLMLPPVFLLVVSIARFLCSMTLLLVHILMVIVICRLSLFA